MSTVDRNAARMFRAALAISLVLQMAAASRANAQTEVRITVMPSDAIAYDGGSLAVRTLEDALLRARQVRRTRSSGAVVIELMPGVHRLKGPVRLGTEDSGTDSRPLVIRGPDSNTAVITGGVLLRPLAPDPVLMARYPAGARPHLKVYALPEAAARAKSVDTPRRYDKRTDPIPFEVFDRHGPLRPARWPNESWAEGLTLAETGTKFRGEVLRLATWVNEPDLWISGSLRHEWTFEQIPVARIEPGTGQIWLSYAPQFGFARKLSYAVHHARDELDQPGEWHRDAASGKLVVWPRAEGNVIALSVEQLHWMLEGIDLAAMRAHQIIRYRRAS